MRCKNVQKASGRHRSSVKAKISSPVQTRLGFILPVSLWPGGSHYLHIMAVE